MKPITLPAEGLAALYGRSLLTTSDFSDSALRQLLALAEAFARLDRAGVRTDLLPAQLAYAMFFDNSTRTKSAWAGAAARLGMHPVIVDGSSTQVAHGETAAETGAMIGMNAHALGVRHDKVLGAGNRFMREVLAGVQGYLDATRDDRKVPLVNLQCDVDHPTQTLADLRWLHQRVGDLRGKRVAISWAYSPSYAKPLSVPQGLATLLTRFGAHVTLAHPPGYELLDEPMTLAHTHADRSGGTFRVVHDMDEAFRDADVVYPKSWGPMDLMQARVGAGEVELVDIEQKMLALNAKHTGWICDEARMARTREALYMHCLPADIGAEVSPGVMDRFRVDLAREANEKLYVIMALLAGAKVPDLAERLAAVGGNHVVVG